MATVQLSDVYNPLVFAQAAQEKQLELNRFITSGVAVSDDVINNMASVGGNIGELPFYLPLSTAEPNYSNDDNTDNSTPLNITDGKMIYRLCSQNNSWSVMDISRELALADPVGAITGRIGQYWATNNEKRVINTIKGVIADNIANDSEDMLFDISVDIDTASTTANLIDADAIIDTIQTMGDHGEMLGAIAMHSVVYRRMQKLDLIDDVIPSEADLNIRRYQGKVIIVDDSLAGTTYGTTPVNTYYDTILFGMGQVLTGEGIITNASEFDRDPSSGNGGGEEIIYSRRSDIIHPTGFQFTSSSVVGQSATQAELAVAANWDRVYNRKNVSLAVLRSNG